MKLFRRTWQFGDLSIHDYRESFTSWLSFAGWKARASVIVIHDGQTHYFHGEARSVFRSEAESKALSIAKGEKYYEWMLENSDWMNKFDD